MVWNDIQGIVETENIACYGIMLIDQVSRPAYGVFITEQGVAVTCLYFTCVKNIPEVSCYMIYILQRNALLRQK